jgi:hypothetical protein
MRTSPEGILRIWPCIGPRGLQLFQTQMAASSTTAFDRTFIALATRITSTRDTFLTHSASAEVRALRCRSVHCVGHDVEPIAEEVPVLIERHRRRVVAKHLLHHLHIGAGCDSQGRGRVPSLVRVETRNAQTLGCLSQRRRLERLRPHHRTPFTGEDQITRGGASNPPRKSSTRKRGIDTSRRSCPFVGLNVILTFSDFLGCRAYGSTVVKWDRPAAPPA